MKNKNSFWIDRWNYSVADIPTVLDEKIVFISIACFGPLEIDELGLDEQNKPYELHKWCEDDLYEDENYCRNISMEELIKKMEYYISFFQKQNLTDAVDSCKKLVTWLKVTFT